MRLFPAILMIGICLPLSGLAWQSQNYLPLSRAELGKPFALKHVADTAQARTLKTIAAGVGGITVSRPEEDGDAGKPEGGEEISGPVFSGPVFSGKDRQGKPWTAQLGEKLGLGGNLFTADLDKNGIEDLLLVFPTGGNGLAPSSHILMLMFDAAGRPVPFEVEGYYDADATEIAELVDLNRDGRAELVFMNFADGYWITNIYTVSEARWQRVTGKFQRRSYPLYTRFTNRPNRLPATPARGRKPFAPDLSNRAPQITGRLLSFTWARADADGNDFAFVIEDTRGAKIASDPDDWFATTAFVFDGVEGRQILSPWANETRLKRLLDESIRRGDKTTLFGRRSAAGVSPELIWISER